MEEELVEIAENQTGYYYYNLLTNLEKYRFVENYNHYHSKTVKIGNTPTYIKPTTPLDTYLELNFINLESFISKAFSHMSAKYPEYKDAKYALQTSLKIRYWALIGRRTKLPKYRFEQENIELDI